MLNALRRCAAAPLRRAPQRPAALTSLAMLGVRTRTPIRLCTTASGVYSPPEEQKRIREMQGEMSTLYRAGRYGEARDLGNECHQLVLKFFGTEHPATASAANNLALMHKSLGETEAAQRLYGEALQIYRAVVGEEHVSTATAACNLAMLLRDSGDSEKRGEAIELLEGALETRRKLLGETHAEVAGTLQQLASVVGAEAEGMERASELLEQALELLERADGEAATAADGGGGGGGGGAGRRGGQPFAVDARRELRLATTLNSLGLLRKRQARLAEANSLYTRALRLRETLLGAAHPDTIACLHNLAELTRTAGDEQRAGKLQQEILRRLDQSGAAKSGGGAGAGGG